MPNYFPPAVAATVSNVDMLTLLYKLTAADMTLTTDQAFVKIATFNEAILFFTIGMPKTGKASVACSGGFYDTAAKGGNAYLAAGSSWLTLDATISPKVSIVYGSYNAGGAQLSKLVSTGAMFLSLTAGSTAACTADIYIYGKIMS